MTAAPRFLALVAMLIAALPFATRAETVARFEGDGLANYREAGAERQLRRSDLTPLLRGRPNWVIVADIAQLGRAENKDWRLTRADCLPPAFRRCLFFLAESGKAGVVLREYDARDRRFADGGFALPPGPTRAVWYDENRIMLAANTGPGTLTARGVPRLLKLWTRGEPVYAATTILAAPFDVADIRPIFSLSGGGLFHAAEITTAAGGKELYHFGWAQNFKRSAVPTRAEFLDFFQGQAVALLHETWAFAGRRYLAGSIVAYPVAPFLGPHSRTFAEQAYLPPAGYGVIGAKAGRDMLYIALRGAGDDRIVSIRKGAPDWPIDDVSVPGDGPMTLVAASTLADVALVERGVGPRQLYVAGRGRAREIAP